MDKLVIHFKHHLLGQDPLVFENAIEFVVAKDVSEVKNAIKQIESYSKQGYYAVGYISYEAAKAFNNEMEVHENVKLPYVYFGIYENKVC